MTEEMNNKGLTATIVFEANSANYGQGLGNVSTLKKLTRANGEQYTYISRQALRYNIMQQLGEPLAKLSEAQKVVQFDADTTIDQSPEIDFFGYMKTASGSNGIIRSAKVRLSNAISQEPFESDTDFLTNLNLATRLREEKKDDSIKNSIAQSEVQQAFYVYTVSIDLDQIGIDTNTDTNLSSEEKSKRIQKLLDTIQYLYRDIRGRREDLKPLFIIGGVYDIKNPLFANEVKVKNRKIQIDTLQDVLADDRVAKNTQVGVINGIFDNTDEIKSELHATNIPTFFKDLKAKVADYYEGN